MNFTNKSFLVLGAGISGISAANVLSSLGGVSTLSDAKSYDELSEESRNKISAGVRLEFGRQDKALLDGQDYLVLSPGVSIYHPLVDAAQGRGIPVFSEIEIAYHLSEAPIIAITGTNGKTTTTTLIGEMVKTLGKKTVVGGNIGIALSREVLGLPADGLVVAEISSFQLEAIHDFRARIAAVLNLTPDHIDRHRNVETYQLMKERIFANQQASDYTVLNFDDLTVREMAARTAGQVLFFSRKQQLAEGVCVDAGIITVHWQGKSVAICPISDMNLRGAHNLENALAACGVAYLAGVKPADMARVLREFAGVEHRIEPVATIKGVAYFNDSKATNPESAVKALEAFSGHIILIAGGRDKNTDLHEFMTLVSERVDHLILIGEAAARFAQEAGKHAVKNIHTAETFSAAVALAYRLAAPPQVVLLSPACASYDMFNNYEERGKLFKALVRDLSAN
ncbi:UDP-N-acetylmuramoylalanine--D-glutamate ligase [Anaerosporomusa subterranea]|uniref:UDP-N-acetylmuramoylalanine--D-glutamate ligase n=1 Tax=Anaerosporomusa subterranea TaxID=1794912 RepID=A0A154BSX1_ANASB|nr:UDP-N-acetylmuramoyl-L-alanine--D-glutamate ligase [Anaerosporomusa subterranea]KYZ77103.1 UDP-N-acetylmuramoylalanine--D-glutamate ligase [Anaerosporomusa subterranea]